MNSMLGNLDVGHIYQIDCLEGMKLIPEESIDMCVIDPPYKLTSGGKKDSVFRGSSGRVSNPLSPTGKIFEYNNIQSSEYMSTIYRVLKQGTHFYCMTNDKNLKNILASAEEVGFKLHNILVWKKGMHTPSQFYLKNIEYILFLRKGKAKYINNMGSYTLIEIDGIFGDKVHPSQKPVQLMQHLILNSTNEGDVVLDCFMGSGTTAIACETLLQKRKWIGFEIDPKYFDITNARLKTLQLRINDKIG